MYIIILHNYINTCCLPRCYHLFPIICSNGPFGLPTFKNKNVILVFTKLTVVIYVINSPINMYRKLLYIYRIRKTHKNFQFVLFYLLLSIYIMIVVETFYRLINRRSVSESPRVLYQVYDREKLYQRCMCLPPIVLLTLREQIQTLQLLSSSGQL